MANAPGYSGGGFYAQQPNAGGGLAGFYSALSGQPAGKGGAAGAAAGTQATSGPVEGYYTPPGSSTPQPIYGANGTDSSGMGTPQQQQDAASHAGATAYTTGNEVASKANPAGSNYMNPGGAGYTTPTPGMLSGPGYGEDWWTQHGNDLSGKTNSQKLFDEGVAGSNPFYQNAIKETNKAIDLEEAARGTGNSGAALAEIGTADANLLGQQALGLTNLANQADTSNTSQFTAGSNASATAEGLTNARGAGAASAYTNLSQDQANMVDNFYKMAQDGQLQTNMAAIEAQLAASGVDAATAQAITNDLLQVGAIATKASSGGK